MKILQILLGLGLLLMASCTNQKGEIKDNKPSVNWQSKYCEFHPDESLFYGKTYLSVYSEIYMFSEEKTYNLTVTVSLKNIYPNDTVYITKATYFDTHGKPITTYFDKPVALNPMETAEIVIGQKDNKGGSGGNFLFDWAVKKESLEPHFEAVMISTTGQQGLSFTSQGIRIK